MKANETRVFRAAWALRAIYKNDPRRILPEDVIGILTDIRHLCGLKGWTFHDLDGSAYARYVANLATNPEVTDANLL